jgi:hypothetical protein
MKKILSIFLIGFTVLSFAQNGPNEMKKRNQFTSEQQAILKTKQLVLQLDLNKFQESQILALNKKGAEKRQKIMESNQARKQGNQQLSSDEKFKMKIKMLDTQIKYQAEIKNVLDEKQFEEWRVSSKRQYSMKKRKMHADQKQKQKMKNEK